MVKAKPAVGGTITLPDFKVQEVKVFLIGTAPLIVHAFPEKARKEMLDKQRKIAKGGRDARDPYAEMEASRYPLPEPHAGDGFPAIGFKAAAVTACTSLSDITKVAARQAFRVSGISMDRPGVLEGSFVRTALVPLIAKAPVMREDVARLSGPGRPPEMRYRPEYSTWGVELNVSLNPQVISIEQMMTMFDAAGHGVGIGDYRPEKDGDCGTFRVVNEGDFLVWRQEHHI
jgi:hypothetical protein